MTKNMGTADRLARALLVAPAALVAALVLGVGSLAGVALLAVAGIMVATAAAGFCPLYAVLRLSSCPRKAASRA